jgi:hypothetical protein
MKRPAVSESATLQADPEVLVTEFGDEVVLLNLRDGVYYGLEDVGARIWTMLRQPVTIQTLCEAIVSEFDVAQDRCERDVRAIVSDLLENGLIQMRGGR